MTALPSGERAGAAAPGRDARPDAVPGSSADLYLDHAASTPLDPAVLDAMLPVLRGVHGNPSSVHRAGQAARRVVEEARERVAAALGARAREIVLLGGATEADNLAVRGALAGGGRLVTSPLEHAAVLEPARAFERAGGDVAWLRPDDRGAIDPEAVREAVRGGARLVALMLVNNETGVRTDVAAAAQFAREAGALVLCDAVQAFGLERVRVDELGVDLLAISAHKFGGPKGAGALYVRSGLELPPLLVGGSQEGGRRAGTPAVPALAGLGAAVEVAEARRESDAASIRAARDAFEADMLALGGVAVNGGGAPRGPKHSNLRFEGARAEDLLLLLDQAGVAASAGSACAAGSIEPSHVLGAMGLTPEGARSSLRFSFGRGHDAATGREAARRVARAVTTARALAG